MGTNVTDITAQSRSGGVGVVAIGRNEGSRLRQCLESVLPSADAVVYVDSGSTDDSVAVARQLGAEVVELNLEQPFTAARARNAGLERLRSADTNLEFVQFVDGDCEVVGDWLSKAATVLSNDPSVAVVCGRRRERFPKKTIYNQLCDIEWDTPVGSAKYCGGDAMMRIVALTQVGGYNGSLIAGEEPELCVRLRAAGWSILRIDEEMTLHDAAMSRFGQWWKRTVRAGYAYAEGAAIHGAPPEKHFVREVRSALFWGLAVPAAAFVLAWPSRGISLLLLLGYFVLLLKIYRAVRPRIGDNVQAFTYSFFVVVAKIPELIGQLTYRWTSLLGRQRKLIEYK